MRMYEIYRIITPTGRTYYGQHLNHKYPDDDGYMGSGRLLLASIRKHGLAGHKKTILMICKTKEEVDGMEELVVDLAKKIDGADCLNMAPGGTGGLTGNQFKEGHIVSQLTKEKLHRSHLGKVPPNKGKLMPEEQKRKISLAKKGKPAWNKGKHGSSLSAIHKKRISDAQRGKPHNISEDGLERIRHANRNKEKAQQGWKTRREKYGASGRK